MVKTHCSQGHPWVPENITPLKKCLLCQRIRITKNYHAKKVLKGRPLLTHCKRGHERTPKNVTKNGDCRICAGERAHEYNKKYYQDNRDLVLNRNSAWREDNKERMNILVKRWYADNAERAKYNGIKWRGDNKATCAAQVKKRQAAKLQRTPKWLTQAQIKDIRIFYMLSEALTKETGVRHHVDHIVPLQGKNVSGLHVPWNLQVLTATENMAKWNHHA